MSSSRIQATNSWHSSAFPPQNIHPWDPTSQSSSSSGHQHFTPYSTSRVHSPAVGLPSLPPSTHHVIPDPPPVAPSPVIPSPPPHGALPAHNKTALAPGLLRALLDHLSLCLASPHAFNGMQVTLVVHGGVVMLLHPRLSALAEALEKEGQRYSQYHPEMDPQQAALEELGIFPRRTTTRDVDFIARGFNAYWATRGIDDAEDRLKQCVKSTAYAFYNLSIGEDWVNSEADISLPMATDPTTGVSYDPIIRAALQPNNIKLYTVYNSPNGLLRLVGVSPAWAVALKLVRYGPRDWADVALILRNGSHVPWTAETVEKWLRGQCSAMLFDHRDAKTKMVLRSKIEHAVDMFHRSDHSGRNKTATNWGDSSWTGSAIYSLPQPTLGTMPDSKAFSSRSPRYPDPSEFETGHPTIDLDGDFSSFQRPRSRARQRQRGDTPQPFIPPGFEHLTPASDPAFSEIQDRKKEHKKSKKKRDKDRAMARHDKQWDISAHPSSWVSEQSTEPRQSLSARPSIYDMSNVEPIFANLSVADVPTPPTTVAHPSFNSVPHQQFEPRPSLSTTLGLF